MGIIVGIDAGGTFTDCVALTSEGNHLLHKGKTPTTKSDLAQCLEASFAAIPPELLPNVSLVCLSTTLATNAIVEGHGCKEGLILIGRTPSGRIPSSVHATVKGRFDIKGRQVENLDPAQVLEVIESFRGKVDAVAISGYASVRCPEHELFVKAMVEQQLGIPVVCAHELSGKLGFSERTVTAALNARLIPLVCDLMDSMASVMERYGITAPLMMVRGDGTLMTDAQARHKPIETILSGPAASAIGAVHLSGRRDCFVVDIGGTTTDVANLTGGRLTIRPEGARVGGWSAQMRAAEVFTIGLGGDSWIHQDAAGELQLGPERAVSYSSAAVVHPGLVDQLEQLWEEQPEGFVHSDVQDAFALVRKFDNLGYTDEEGILIEILRYQPRTLGYLSRNARVPGLRRVLGDLVRHGVVERISLTPTDLWHLDGTYAPGNVRAAELALGLTARHFACPPEELVARVRRKLARELDLACVRAALYVDHQELGMEEGGAADYFLNRLSFQPDSQALRASYELQKPVVVIGAPAATWLGGDPRPTLFRGEIPRDAEVANAIGAAVAHAVEKVEILIRKDSVTGRYLVFAPTERIAQSSLEAATQAALDSAEAFIARLAGGTGYQVSSSVEDFEVQGLTPGQTLFVERLVSISAHF